MATGTIRKSPTEISLLDSNVVLDSSKTYPSASGTYEVLGYGYLSGSGTVINLQLPFFMFTTTSNVNVTVQYMQMYAYSPSGRIVNGDDVSSYATAATIRSSNRGMVVTLTKSGGWGDTAEYPITALVRIRFKQAS